MLLVKIMLCGKFHCIRVLKWKLLSYMISGEKDTSEVIESEGGAEGRRRGGNTTQPRKVLKTGFQFENFDARQFTTRTL
jgi:hypothetical protein